MYCMCNINRSDGKKPKPPPQPTHTRAHTCPHDDDKVMLAKFQDLASNPLPYEIILREMGGIKGLGYIF